jgi:regulator of protease activity HflC (stomatin/prohibitin superfamily)
MSTAQQAGRALREAQLGMPNYLPLAVFAILAVVCVALAFFVGTFAPELGILLGAAGIVVSALVAASVKVANQWERGIVLRVGSFLGIRGPGLFFITPILERVRIIDMRVQTEDIRRQEVITRDNVPVAINGVLFFQVVKVEDAVMKVRDFLFAVSQLAQTALRDVVGGMTLDEVLAERERIGKMIQDVVEKDAQAWGLEVTGIRLQDIDMPEELKKMISRQAAAEREKRATITKAEGDKLAAANLAAAAATMTASPGAMQLRTLQTIDGLGPTASNTVVLAVPIEIMELVKRFGGQQTPP